MWSALLDDAATKRGEIVAAVREDELARARRITRAAARERFLLSRGILRLLLGGYLGVEPRTIAFSYGIHGKPRLQDPSPWRFNVSHAAGIALYGFAMDREIGVDVEPLRGQCISEESARRALAPSERRDWEGRPPSERRAAFLRLWTGKEACAKAAGVGLRIRFAEIEPFAVGESLDAWRLVCRRGNGPSWIMIPLDPAPGYLGTVALSGTVAPAALRLERWKKEDVLAASGRGRGGVRASGRSTAPVRPR